MVDYYIYDKHNPLTHHSYYNRFTRSTDVYNVEFRIEGDSNQSLTVLTNLINAGKAAKGFGFNKLFYITFDFSIDEKDHITIENGFNKLDSDWHACLATLNTPFGKGIQTNGMFFKSDFISKLIDDVRTSEEYNSLCESIGAQNFLEDYLMKKVNKTEGVWVEYPECETFLQYTGEGKSSNSEYAGIVKCEEEDCNYFYFYTYNSNLSSYNIKEYDENKNLLNAMNFTDREVIKYLSKNVCVVELELVHNNSNQYFHVNNIVGTIDIKKVKKPIEARPKIKLVHLQTTLNDNREKASRDSLQKVKNYGWEYILHTNYPYEGLPPRYNCNRPDCVSMELFDAHTANRIGTALTPPHYGCYEAFKNAILSEFDDCDYLIVCEGDCIVEVDILEFVNKVEDCGLQLENNNIAMMSFGDKRILESGWLQSPIVREVNDLMYVTNNIIGLQCVMFPKFIKKYIKEKLLSQLWDATDLYFNIVFENSKYNMGIVHNRLTTQADGYSLIDKTYKKFIKK